MRLWLVNPKIMCRKHLLGEHLECHMFVGTLNKGISVEGYVSKGLLETSKLKERHDALAYEIIRRGYKHNSPLKEFKDMGVGEINKENSLKELLSRCKECKERYDLL
jgi:hypothetical protein